MGNKKEPAFIPKADPHKKETCIVRNSALRIFFPEGTEGSKVYHFPIRHENKAFAGIHH